MTRSRTYTLTKFTEEGKNPPEFVDKHMRYLCYAPEYTSTGKFHWQAYIVWKSQKTITASAKYLKKQSGEAVNHEISNGSAQDNKTYCKGPYVKGDKTKPVNPGFVEFGEMPSQGARKDLIELKKSIVEGKSVDDITMENPVMYHQYGRTLQKIEDIVLRSKHRTEMTKCDWLVGTTGVGKSHKAFEGYDPKTHYVWKDDNGWQDGYVGQKIVIINDFRGGIKYNEMLQLIDKWPHCVRRRCREPAPFLAEKIIITSSLTPQECYSGLCERDNIDQLLRRVKVERMSGTPFGLGLRR